MELTDNIKDSLMYPLSEIKNLAIFTLILLSCVFILTIPLFTGYLYRIIKETIEGNDVLPEFDDLGQMYIDGLMYLGVGLIYGLFVGIIMFILIYIGAATNSGVILALSIIVSILLLIIVLAFCFVATFNMINENDFGAAFDFSTIIAIIQDIGVGEYIIWTIVITIIGIVVNGIGGLFSWTFIIPLIISCWLYCFQARSLALLFAYE